MSPLSASPRPSLAARRAWRLGVVLALVLGLHGLAGLWLTRFREPFKPLAPVDAPIEIALLKPQPLERQPAAAPVAPRRKAAHGDAPHRAAAPSAPAAPPVLSALDTAHTPVTTPASAPSAASGTAASAAAAGGDAHAAHADANAEHAATGVKFLAPPSGDLQYDTFYNGVQNATGTILWRSDGRTYTLSVTMPVPFVGPFRYHSRGRIAIFNREAKQIVFTRTPNSLALPDGAQDRFSMLMQLAGLLRGAPDTYRPGVTREFYVVDNNSGEIWPITTIGDETVQTAEGSLPARHFMRLPRRPGDTRRLDLWLAPSLDWLPARMVQTEPNGAQIELLWHGRRAPPAAAPDAPAPGADSEPVNSTGPAATDPAPR